MLLVSGIAVLGVSGTSNLRCRHVSSTSGTQTYTGAVTLSANVTLTSSGDVITFSNTVNSADSTNRNLTSYNWWMFTVTYQFWWYRWWMSKALGAIAITGVLDLNAAIADATFFNC